MEYLVRGKFVFSHNERYGSDGIIPDGAVYVSGVTPALTDRAPSLAAELYPYVLRYYQAWDDEIIIPHHKVNSIN